MASPPAATCLARSSAVLPSQTSRRGGGMQAPWRQFLLAPSGRNAKLDLGASGWHVIPLTGIRRKIMADFDLAIVGGGINGAGIARDAAGRGLSVLLIE